MAHLANIRATLLYPGVPDLSLDDIKTPLRALARERGLPASGAVDQRDGFLCLALLPYEITISLHDSPLPASTFNGALRASRPDDRSSLGEAVIHHAAYIKVDVRDTGEARVRGEVAGNTTRKQRQSQILAQDVLRLITRKATPLALHWHTGNTLAKPDGLAASQIGALYLPLCLRAKATMSQIEEPDVGDLAQSIEGSEELLGKPVQVMATGMTSDEALNLSLAFVARCLDTDARPRTGARFTEPGGRTARIVDLPVSADMPNGMIVLIEDARSVRAGTETAPHQSSQRHREPAVSDRIGSVARRPADAAAGQPQESEDLRSKVAQLRSQFRGRHRGSAEDRFAQ